MILKYDTPTEVTQKEYTYLKNNLGSYIATRVSEGKYYIKAWLNVEYCNEVFTDLRNTN